MSDLLCSGQEPSALIKLTGAQIDSDCEHLWGADFMWITPYGMALIQRKRFPDDFMASYRSGDRLDKEIMQFEGGFWKYILLEIQEKYNGKIPWGSTDEFTGDYKGRGSISRYELESFIESLENFHKIHTRWTTNLTDTAKTILRLHKWTCKETHSGIIPMRSCPSREEIKKFKGDWRRWILSGFHGMGAATALAILKNEPEPLEWKNGGYWLEDIAGIGKIKAKQFREALKPR